MGISANFYTIPIFSIFSYRNYALCFDCLWVSSSFRVHISEVSYILNEIDLNFIRGLYLPRRRTPNQKTISHLFAGSKNEDMLIARCILFQYNLIEFGFEITVIALVSYSFVMKGRCSLTVLTVLFTICSFSAASLDDTYVIMLSYYIHLLTLVNRHIFICIACAFTKCTKEHSREEQGSATNIEAENLIENDDDAAQERGIHGPPRTRKPVVVESVRYMPIIMFIFPIWIWTCTRYMCPTLCLYGPELNFLVHNIIIVTEPMTYFYSLLRPGICMSR